MNPKRSGMKFRACDPLHCCLPSKPGSITPTPFALIWNLMKTYCKMKHNRKQAQRRGETLQLGNKELQCRTDEKG